jgi:mechanosensitive ion channel-like protein
MREGWTDITLTAFREVAQRLATLAPRVLAALTLILAGWAVAAIARRVGLRLLRAVDLDGRCARWGITPALVRTGVRVAPSALLASLAFWILFWIAALMAIEALEVPATTGLVAAVVRWVPNLLVAVLVLGIGWIVAHFLGQAVLIFAVNAQLVGGRVLAGAARWLVFVFAGSVALTQLDIAREMVLLAFGIAFGGTVLALALAFGLGGRDIARQAIEAWLGTREEDETSDHLTHL